MWKSQRKWLFLPLLVSLWLAAASTSRAEEMYQISESELTTLERDLNQLEKSNANKQDLLTEQQKQLETAEKELTESKKTNYETQKLLESANQSLQQLEQEAKHKIRVKTKQRNLWIAISGFGLYAYVKKQQG